MCCWRPETDDTEVLNYCFRRWRCCKMIDLCTSFGRACTNHFCHLKVALEAEEAHAEELREAKSRYVLYYNSQFNLNFFISPQRDVRATFSVGTKNQCRQSRFQFWTIVVTSWKKFLLKTNLKQPHSDVRQASHHEVPVSLPWEQVHTQLKGEQVLLVHPTKQVQCHSEPVQFPPTCTLTMEQVQHHQNWQFNNHQSPLCLAPPSSTSPAS